MTSLYCQKCREPLRIDGSLEHLSAASFKILADAAPLLKPKAPGPAHSVTARDRQALYDDVSKDAGAPLHKRQISAGQKMSSSKSRTDMSYILLGDSQMITPDQSKGNGSNAGNRTLRKTADHASPADGQTSLSQNMETAIRLFEVLSSRSDIDHPVCSDCTELLLENFQRRQADVIRERDAYAEFVRSAQQDAPTPEEKAETQKALKEAKQLERRALDELEALEREKAKMELEIAALEDEGTALEEEEEAFWRERNAFAAKLSMFESERDSLQTQLSHETSLLEALQRTNVYNDTFCIGHDGTFGTINGLRLGRTTEHPVDWSEINAAWGQTLLLLTVVTEKLGISLRGYELVPVGSTSKVIKIDQSQTASIIDSRAKRTVFELYSSGDLPLGLGFLHRNFDNAMIAFLECLRQTGEHVENTTPRQNTTGLRMPYPIVKDKIGDVSIKLGNFGQEEQWTKACKYTLTCCKFLLAHASHISDVAETRSVR
ncbi:APG6-domain-containing protein [Dissoconium aciculare CBS 342.82]|uniref:APG6-domain-containing protein n=1 Tax=Dissoconium aciculare CBS 342.82 TaxID=1314786 RepID=A0A6J3LTR7_9PEZI|nr:APG6-domain-containing protein [Dissoconium aciculare CBS 342.82]KAF1819023.1 APG6-domain-containing protein [Dissoconium aciculare CBS 342.82]